MHDETHAIVSNDDHTPRICDDADLFWKCTFEEPRERLDRERELERRLETELQRDLAWRAGFASDPAPAKSPRMNGHSEPLFLPPPEDGAMPHAAPAAQDAVADVGWGGDEPCAPIAPPECVGPVGATSPRPSNGHSTAPEAEEEEEEEGARAAEEEEEEEEQSQSDFFRELGVPLRQQKMTPHALLEGDIAPSFAKGVSIQEWRREQTRGAPADLPGQQELVWHSAEGADPRTLGGTKAGLEALGQPEIGGPFSAADPPEEGLQAPFPVLGRFPGGGLTGGMPQGAVTEPGFPLPLSLPFVPQPLKWTWPMPTCSPRWAHDEHQRAVGVACAKRGRPSLTSVGAESWFH